MAAIDDWVDMLSEHSQEKIQKACLDYMKREPYKRPTPGGILRMISDTRKWYEKPESEWTKADRDAERMRHL